MFFFPRSASRGSIFLANGQAIRACSHSLQGLTKGALHTSPQKRDHKDERNRRQVSNRSCCRNFTGMFCVCHCSRPCCGFPVTHHTFFLSATPCLESTCSARAWRYSPRTSRPEPSRVTDPTWREFGPRRKPCPRGCDLLLYVAPPPPTRFSKRLVFTAAREDKPAFISAERFNLACFPIRLG